jgi:hypothetical protein
VHTRCTLADAVAANLSHDIDRPCLHLLIHTAHIANDPEKEEVQGRGEENESGKGGKSLWARTVDKFCDERVKALASFQWRLPLEGRKCPLWTPQHLQG